MIKNQNADSILFSITFDASGLSLNQECDKQISNE